MRIICRTAVKHYRKEIGKLVSPCRGCFRESRDKRYGECKGCDAPYRYAMAVEEIYCHLPNGIDCSDVHCSTDGRVNFLSELRVV